MRYNSYIQINKLRQTVSVKMKRMFSYQRPTIFQLSSGFSRCGVAVVRISGESSREAIKLMTNSEDLEPRKLFLRKIRDSVTKEILDTGFIVRFPKPKSFTGEDMVELHIHGGPAVTKAVLSGLGKIHNFQPAEPGEFTRRAFMNGKLDLTEVEGLADLLQAETEAQRRQALKQMEGALGKLYTSWRQKLIKALAQMEAYIDFGEEENIEEALELVKEGLNVILIELEKHLTNATRGQRLRCGVKTTIIGKPNVGKSSLLNVICGEDLAIISPIAGTTRDVVESTLNVGGYPMIISDTAGIRRDTKDPIEVEGVRRALKRASEADLVIAVHDASCLPVGPMPLSFLADVKALLEVEHVTASELIFAVNKVDQLNPEIKKEVVKQISNVPNAVLISCLTGEGLEELSNVILDKLKSLCGNPLEENASITQERHRFHVQACYERINRCLDLVDEQVVVAAEELRLAVRSLGKITGKITTEEVLDVIFRDFCIGK